MARSGFDARPFNVVAIARERASSRAIESLKPIGAFRATPYRRVLIGELPEDASAWLVRAWPSERPCFDHVVRMIPLEQVVAFERDDVTEQLCCELETSAERVRGRSFHVRVRLRGLTGRVEKSAVERALGAYLLELAEASGSQARVAFADADLVLAVEVIGKRVGYGFLERAVRSIPIVRPR